MEVKIIDKKQNELKIEIDDLTICEVLRKELWEDKNIVQASYTRKHPTENPVLHLQTDGKSAKKALQDAIARLSKKNEEILKAFKAAK
ncbi:MAG: hypothetical protein KJ767_03945 [Nanoarchaeota archaeon]|nr:hypothetical protein [Nanoarchaeota archaeon]